MRTFVYVDGFNLYYGALKGKPWKWLTPGTGRPSQQLRAHADFSRHIRPNALRNSQLPDPIPDTNIRKPGRW